MADRESSDISGVAGVKPGVPDHVGEAVLRGRAPSGTVVQMRVNEGGTLLTDLASGDVIATVGTINQVRDLQAGTLNQVQHVQFLDAGTINQLETIQDIQGGTIDQLSRPRTDFEATLAQDFDVVAASTSIPGTFAAAQLDGFTVGFQSSGHHGGTFTVDHEMRLAPGGVWFRDGRDGTIVTDLVTTITHKAFQYRPSITNVGDGATLDAVARGS